MTKNDSAWEKLFFKYKIENQIKLNGDFIITSSQINEFREARLMTKFDHKSNLPQIFQDNKYSILPISRGEYLIASIETHHDFEKKSKAIQQVYFPENIQSVDFNNITSEAIALNVAFITGIFSDFSEEKELFPTVSGRMSSEKFSFKINNKQTQSLKNIFVNNSQVEIDGAYEGFDKLLLVEAKNSISDDFLIRQIYYPYRLWEKKISKEILPIFFTYSNGIFSLYQYLFENKKNYNSLKLIKQKNYRIEPKEISLDDIIEISKTSKKINEPEISFPQADSFERVVNLCELLVENEKLYKDRITNIYDFDVRQTDYYTNACRYLDLVNKEEDEEGIYYKLSKKGEEIFHLGYRDRNLALIKQILIHKPFLKTFEHYLAISSRPNKDVVVKFMKNSNLYNITSDVTYKRRSSTVLSWVDWILDLVD